MPDVLAQDDNVLSFEPSNPFLGAPDAGPLPVAASRAGADLQPRIDEAGRRSQAAIDLAERSMGLEERNAEARERELAPIRERQMEMARQPIPQPPKTKESPPAPQRQNQHDDENWLFAAGLLGSLAGAFTRNHATNALAAFSGALQGYQEGSKQKFDENMQIWNAENKRAQEASQNALSEYRSILENRKLSIEQMSVELQVATAKHDDRAMQTAAKTKNFLTIAQLHDKQFQALEQMKTTSDRLFQNYELAQEREQNKMAIAQMRALGVVPGQENALVDAIGQYKQAPITGARGSAIMNLVQDKYPDYDIKSWFDQKARSTIPASAERAGQTSEARAGGTRAAQMDMILRTARAVIPQAAAAADKIPSTSFVPLNKLLQMVDSEIGNPNLREFKMVNLALAETWARSMNPTGVMRVEDRRLAMDILSTADSPQAYHRALQTLNQFLEREITAVRESREHKPLQPMELGPGKGPTSFSGAAGPVAERATGVADELGVPHTPQFGVGASPPSQRKPPSSSADMPMMLPQGWKLEQVQ
jgi:hypothetical protein